MIYVQRPDKWFTASRHKMHNFFRANLPQQQNMMHIFFFNPHVYCIQYTVWPIGLYLHTQFGQVIAALFSYRLFHVHYCAKSSGILKAESIWANTPNWNHRFILTNGKGHYPFYLRPVKNQFENVKRSSSVVIDMPPKKQFFCDIWRYSKLAGPGWPFHNSCAFDNVFKCFWHHLCFWKHYVREPVKNVLAEFVR